MQLTKRRKNSIFTFVIRLGGVAQLVERLNGIQEVRGSTPLISTTYKKNEPDFIGFFFFFGDSARRCRAACGVNPFELTASEERSKCLHLRKSSAADIANDCAICRTNAQHCCLQQIVERRRSFLRYFGEKEHTSKRVSIIAPNNAISKAQCATLLRYYANVVCYDPPHLHHR